MCLLSPLPALNPYSLKGYIAVLVSPAQVIILELVNFDFVSIVAAYRCGPQYYPQSTSLSVFSDDVFPHWLLFIELVSESGDSLLYIF